MSAVSLSFAIFIHFLNSTQLSTQHTLNTLHLSTYHVHRDSSCLIHDQTLMLYVYDTVAVAGMFHEVVVVGHDCKECQCTG